MRRIEFADTDQQISGCFAVMAQLRSGFAPERFVEQIHRQQQHGYRLVFLEEDHQVRAVAGFRISECLAWGKFMYVDDLVTHDEDRSRGFGSQLLDWLVDHAKQQACDEFHLDSGVQRFAAHRFYLQKRMAIRSYHFVIDLRSE